MRNATKRIFKSLIQETFNFGSKILAANLLHTIYLNLYTLVIGKQFSATTLGYYSRADQFAPVPHPISQEYCKSFINNVSEIPND